MPDDNVVYVRLSLARPRPGHEEQVAKMDDELMRSFAAQPGYLHGYRITGGDSVGGRIGRLTLWRSDQDADRAAQTTHILAVRSELLLLIEDQQHIEDSWVAQTFEPAS
jgi:quinol monooxygenase YgiN